MTTEKTVKLEIYLDPVDAIRLAKITSKMAQGRPLTLREAREVMLHMHVGLRDQGVTAQ